MHRMHDWQIAFLQTDAKPNQRRHVQGMQCRPVIGKMPMKTCGLKRAKITAIFQFPVFRKLEAVKQHEDESPKMIVPKSD